LVDGEGSWLIKFFSCCNSNLYCRAMNIEHNVMVLCRERRTAVACKLITSLISLCTMLFLTHIDDSPFARPSLESKLSYRE
jgi:hypothetical protein